MLCYRNRTRAASGRLLSQVPRLEPPIGFCPTRPSDTYGQAAVLFCSQSPRKVGFEAACKKRAIANPQVQEVADAVLIEWARGEATLGDRVCQFEDASRWSRDD